MRTNKYRAELRNIRMRSLNIGASFSPLFSKLRKKEIKRLLKSLEDVPIDDWSSAVDMLEEKYLFQVLRKIYYNVGKESSRYALSKFLEKKQDVWDTVMTDWLSKNAGNKIKTITGSLKKWLSEQLVEVINDRGVEDTTQELLSRVMQRYDLVKDWQIRRIVQTESMMAMSVASDESIRSLGVKFDKVWVSSGLTNTRLSHLEVDGQRVSQDEPFIVGGEMLMHPHDSSMGASPFNIINCACSCIYLPAQ